MKKRRLFTALAFVLVTAGAWAQELAPRDVYLTIVDRRDRPQAGVLVESVEQGSAALTDDKGMHLFSMLKDTDSLMLYLPQIGEAVIPVAGMDSIVVILRNARRFTYADLTADRVIDTGYEKISERSRTESASTLDVQAVIQTTSPRSLFELMNGRVAGLDLTRSSSGTITARIRGSRSITGNNEPLVIIDGMPVDSFDSANAMLNVYDIKTVNVLKEGAMYGSRGSNGVIVISTR